jgi:hypothetical protein
MLDWANLTTRQRLTCLLFSLFLVASWAIVPFDAASKGTLTDIRELLAGVSVTAFMLAILLSPDAVRGRVSGLNPLAAPRICKALYLAAFVSLAMRGILGVFA